MKYSKEQLIEMVKPYFDNDKVNLLYVTEDNQVFYPSGKTQAFSHARVYKLRSPFEIRREDLKPVKKVEEIVQETPEVEAGQVDTEKETLIEMAKELGIQVDKRMGVKKIESLIKEKENAGK